jgi:hypothetical protein
MSLPPRHLAARGARRSHTRASVTFAHPSPSGPGRKTLPPCPRRAARSTAAHKRVLAPKPPAGRLTVGERVEPCSTGHGCGPAPPSVRPLRVMPPVGDGSCGSGVARVDGPPWPAARSTSISGRLLQLSRLTAGAIKAPRWRWRKAAPAASRRRAALDRLPEPTVRADAEGAPRSENRSRTEPEVAVGTTERTRTPPCSSPRSKDARRQAARDRTRPTTGGHRGPADRRRCDHAIRRVENAKAMARRMRAFRATQVRGSEGRHYRGRTKRGLLRSQLPHRPAAAEACLRGRRAVASRPTRYGVLAEIELAPSRAGLLLAPECGARCRRARNGDDAVWRCQPERWLSSLMAQGERTRRLVSRR